MSDELLVSSAGAVMRLQINRPDKRNAITTGIYAAMADALEAAADDPAIHVVTIMSKGEHFTAGNDLKDFLASPPLDADQPVFRFLKALAAFPKILIAGVQGAAVGVGTTLLLHCDLVIAAPDARFSLPFVDLGLVPEAASSLLLPRLIGPQRAVRHLVLGDPFDAETALRYGLVGDIVPEGALEQAVAKMAARIAAKPPEAVRLTKRLLRSESSGVEARIAEEAEAFAGRLRSAEAIEAFTAFFEKRPPYFG